MGEDRQRGRLAFRGDRVFSGSDVWDQLWEKERERVDIHPELIDLIKKWGGRTVLEVGFGTGGDLRQLASLGFRCTGVEISRKAIEKARKILPTRVKLVLSEGEKLPFGDGQFEVIFHQGMLEHYKDPGRFLVEQRRVLKDQGILIVDVPHKWNPYTLYRWASSKIGKWYAGWEKSYSASELKEKLYKLGFEVKEISYRGIWPHQWGKFLYPERVVEKKWIAAILTRFPFKHLSGTARWFYENVHLIKVLSSYNVMAVALKRSVKVVVDGRFAEGGGGIGRNVREIAKKLPENDFLLTIVSTKKLIKGEGKRVRKNIREIILPQKFHWLIWEQIQLPSLLQRLKPDVYHAVGNWGVPIFCPCLVVLTLHDIIPLTEPGYFDRSRLPWLSKRLYWLRIWVGLWKAERVIFDSVQVREQVLEEFKFKKEAAVIPLGVSDEFFGRRQGGDEKILKKYRVIKPYIICHSGIDPRKNLERLMEAFGRLVNSSSSRRDLDLVIPGEGEIRQQLIDQAKSLGLEGRVIFPGWVMGTGLAVLVRNAELVVYPTLAEGFGMPLLEGMAAGVPVVASVLSVLRELGGSVPVYVDPYDVRGIAMGMERGLSQSQNLRIKKGRETAREFMWEGSVGSVAEVYSRVVSGMDRVGD